MGMHTSPQQKVIQIHRKPLEKGKFFSFNAESAIKAMNSMTAKYFQVWLLLTCNQEGYEMALSTAYIASTAGMGKDTVQDAIKFFIKNRYLVLRKGNYYDFYEIPLTEEEIEIEEADNFSF